MTTPPPTRFQTGWPPAGAIVSTPWDLLRFLETIFKTEKLLSRATRTKWPRFVSSAIHWQDTEYGMGGPMQSQPPWGDCRGQGGSYPGEYL